MDLTQEVDVGCPLPLLHALILLQHATKQRLRFIPLFHHLQLEGGRERGREGGRKRERERGGEGEGEGGREGEGEVDCQPHQLLVYAREMSSDHLYKT